MRERIENTRIIDPFFDNAVNKIFQHPEKTAFVMDGPLGLGKSSNFLMRGAYEIAQHVKPVEKNGKMVRESLWAGVRESENSAVATFNQLLENSIFTPAIMALDDSPVKTYGSHPTIIEVSHALPDKTFLSMKIECHGFNNEKAANRLRTREYMGGLIPEMQGVPYHIFETLVERCGRWRTDGMYIEKMINGKKHRLTGVTGLAVVLCDVNIPKREHELYDQYYDKVNKDSLPTMFITPPPPLLHIPIEKATPELLAEYPVTKFEGKSVVWVPNPAVYNMTRHYEEEDENGNKIPWTGYKYWMKRLHNTDSHIRRYIIGVPDTIGGEAAVYNTFVNDEKSVYKRDLISGQKVYAGFDPGGHAAIEMCQEHSMRSLHFFKEFIVEPQDRVSTRKLFRDFFFPYCRKNLSGYTVVLVPDPASTHLGKSIMAGSEESVLHMIKDELRQELLSHKNVKYIIEPCRVRNQETDIRINSLGYFIDQKKCTVDPDECPVMVAALSGGYQRTTLSSGVISDNIDKNNPYSHPAEAGQYVAINILYKIKKGLRDDKGSKSSIRKLRRSR